MYGVKGSVPKRAKMPQDSQRMEGGVESNTVIQQRGENIIWPPTHCALVGERRQKSLLKHHPGDPGERRWVALTTGQLQPEL